MKSLFLLSLLVLALAFTSNAALNKDDLIQRLQYAYSGYCPPDALSSWNCFWCKRSNTTHAQVTLASNHGLNTFGFVAFDSSAQRIYLVFRGTVLTSIKNWVNNLKFLKITPYADLPNIRVHQGFWEDFTSLSSTLIPRVLDLRRQCPHCAVVVTGHSLGGAQAALAAADLNHRGIRVNELITYGSPRVGTAHALLITLTAIGNAAFEEYVAGMSTTIVRVVQNKDIVPHVPPKNADYTHINWEVWNTPGSFRYCYQTEDPSCSDSVTPPFYSIPDHTNYLDVSLGLGRDAGCSGTFTPSTENA